MSATISDLPIEAKELRKDKKLKNKATETATKQWK